MPGTTISFTHATNSGDFACRCHWSRQTDGERTQFKRLTMTGGSSDSRMDELVCRHTNDPRSLFCVT